MFFFHTRVDLCYFTGMLERLRVLVPLCDPATTQCFDGDADVMLMTVMVRMMMWNCVDLWQGRMELTFYTFVSMPRTK